MRNLDTILEEGAKEEVYLNSEDNYSNHPPPGAYRRTCPRCQGPLEFRFAGSYPSARRRALICIQCDVAWIWFEPPGI